MDYLHKTGVFDQLNEEVLIHRKPFLGICLGMQLIFTRSYELARPMVSDGLDGERCGFSNGSTERATYRLE